MNFSSFLRVPYKISKNFRSHRWKYLVSLFFVSLILILVVSFFQPDSLWSVWLSKAIASSIFSAVIFFILFNIIDTELKRRDQERGEVSTGIDLQEFINTIQKPQGSKTEVEIYIMETWTDMLLGRLGDSFLANILNYCQIRYDNLSIKILLLNPEVEEFVTKRKRELEEGGDQGEIDVEKNIYYNLNTLQRIRESLNNIAGSINNYCVKDIIDVRLYNNPPLFAVYANSKNIRLTFFNLGIKTTSSKIVGFPRNSDISNFFIDRFMSIWELETTLDIDKILYLSVSVHDDNNQQVKTFEKVEYIFSNKNKRFYLRKPELHDFLYIESRDNGQNIVCVSIIDHHIAKDVQFSHQRRRANHLDERDRELFNIKYPSLNVDQCSFIELTPINN